MKPKFAVLIVVGFALIGMLHGTARAEARSQSKNLSLSEAREYMLSLINRDRAGDHLPPLQLDDVADSAAQLHSEEMASDNFSSHWHPDGSKPPQRYNDVGGTDYVAENSYAGHLDSPWSSTKSVAQVFPTGELERVEKAFFNERPPNDGHRKNILDPNHTHVGIGLTHVDLLYQGQPNSQRTYCAQEFVSRHGAFKLSKRSFNGGTPFVIDGDLDDSVKMYSVNICREDLPEKIRLSVLQDDRDRRFHGGYTIGTEQTAAIFPAPFKSCPAGTLTVDGKHIHCEVHPDETWKPGLYYIYVYATSSADGNPFPISMITVPLTGTK